jgi:hypothetical protein
MARRDATSKKRQRNKPAPKRRIIKDNQTGVKTSQTAALSNGTLSSPTTEAVKNSKTALCDNDEDGPDCQCFLRRGLFLPPGMDEEILDEGGDAAEQRR